MYPFIYQTPCRVLLIDSDVELAQGLCEHLEERGCTVTPAHTGFQAKRLLFQGNFDIVLLDMGLSDISGKELLRCHCSRSPQPIIMLTAQDSEADRIEGLESGADDCMAKPFSPQELTARMQAVLRRFESTPPDLPKQLVVGSLCHDPATGRTVFAGREVVLTGAEQRVLEALMRSFGCVVNRKTIGMHALGRAPGPYDRSIETHISNVRKKLGLHRANDELMIRNLRGQGYVLAIPEQNAQGPI